MTLQDMFGIRDALDLLVNKYGYDQLSELLIDIQQEIDEYAAHNISNTSIDQAGYTGCNNSI